MSSVLLAPSQNLLTTVMDTAEEDEMRRALMQQGVLLGRHQEEITASRRAFSEISLQLNQLVERFDRLHTSPSVAETPRDCSPFSVIICFAHLANKRFKFICLLHLCPLLSLRRHNPVIKATFSASLLQSSASHDPSEIIIIC